MTTIIERVRTRLRADAIARMRAFLADHPPPGAERVILFGSLARGTHDGASDADLMVIGGEGMIDTGIWDAAERDVDIIPWRAEAWAKALADGHPFALTIRREGIELWHAPDVPPLDQA
jgi:predicted nucleotidyltransferase